jgi:hypothetical protein
MGKEKSKDEQTAPWNGAKPIHQQGGISQIEKLMEENLRLTEEIYKMTKKINRFVLWSRIFGFLKVLIIVAPIVLGIIYFKPILDMLDKAFAPYKELLNIGSGAGASTDNQGGDGIDLGGIDINQLSPELRKLIGK